MQSIAEFDVKDFENVGDTKGVYAKFYTKPVQDDAQTALEGRPIFRDVEFIEIVAAGNSTNVVRRPVRDADKSRFRQAYALFRAGAESQVVGTPLAEVAWISASLAEELAYIKVRTLEQLAELSDSVCGTRPGLYELKRKAAAWVEQAKDGAKFNAIHEENERMRAQMAEMQAKLAELSAGKKSPKATTAAADD